MKIEEFRNEIIIDSPKKVSKEENEKLRQK